MPMEYLTQLQLRVARETAEYLTAHLGERVTISQLAQNFHISQTYLKRSFRLFHGEPVYTWHRRKRMERAGQLLRDTSRSILEIASDCGYDNGSKFAAAFREVMGETPSGYRQRHYIMDEG